jgi:hypothetical protein
MIFCLCALCLCLCLCLCLFLFLLCLYRFLSILACRAMGIECFVLCLRVRFHFFLFTRSALAHVDWMALKIEWEIAVVPFPFYTWSLSVRKNKCKLKTHRSYSMTQSRLDHKPISETKWTRADKITQEGR